MANPITRIARTIRRPGVVLSVVSFALASVVPNFAIVAPAHASGAIAVYRLANWITHERLFTTSQAEVTNAIAAYPGWVSEGTGFYSVASNYTGALPVYRLANWKTHERLFTTSQSEVNNAIAAYPGWVSEGTGFYTVPSSDPSAMPVYRLANWITHERLFTTSQSEVNNAVAAYPGWVSEGIGFYSFNQVPGQGYMICDNPGTFLTSPWTYHSLTSGSQGYTVAQYQALSGYGTTLPPLPSYIIAEGAGAPAARIFAPGSTDVNSAAYNFPATPIVYFFEGGNYGALGLATITGDQFIGGSTSGFPEPKFDDAGGAGGIDAGNGTYYYSGGTSTLNGTFGIGATSVTTTTAIPGYINWVTFADGTTYHIDTVTNAGLTLNLGSSLTASEATGSQAWANQSQPVAYANASAVQGAGTLTLSNSTLPLMQYSPVVVGTNNYVLSSVSGSQSGYTISVPVGLDKAVANHTPVYTTDIAGDVTVSYLNINNDQHNTTGTIYTGAGWTITHNNIHDGNSKGPGWGVAIYGGDEGTIEYNCLDKMGDYGINVFGTNNVFDYNEVRDSNYQPDPGCGCSGGGKWWGTLNADIVNNAFVDDSPGGGVPIWLDNGNAGTNISGNFFDRSYGSAVHSETGFNLSITNNMFQDGGWGNGTGGCGSNCDGAVNLNSSGGFHVPNSRYDNQVTVSGNTFTNNWTGISIWQAGGRSCENSGEGWPYDAGYCSGGFPNSANTNVGGQYYFSHYQDTSNSWGTSVAQAASAGASTIMVAGSVATNDQIGIGDPGKTTTTSTNNVATLNGSQSINAAATAAFPSSGQLRVGTSAAWSDGNGSWTGAILSYTGKTAGSFTGVSLVRGSGSLVNGGPVWGVQPYKATAETCYANDCAVTITPALTAPVNSGDPLTNAGTCQLYATSAALPSGPLAPNGTSYWDGCQWAAQRISISGNIFNFSQSAINAGTPINGGSNTCNAGNNCGTNFMADQYNSGEAPFITQIGVNAMLSNSALTGCPSWDSGCSSNPLKNLNALSSPPGAPAGNGEPAGNDVWTSNTYNGPWTWNTYIFGNCAGGGVFMPADPQTGHSLPSSACQVDFSHWQSDWEQDPGSTYTP